LKPLWEPSKAAAAGERGGHARRRLGRHPGVQPARDEAPHFSLDIPLPFRYIGETKSEQRPADGRVSVARSRACGGVRRLALASALALAACQTAGPAAPVGQAPAGGGAEAGAGGRRASFEFYTPFFDQGDHLKSFLKKGDFANSARLVAEQPGYFAADREESRDDLKRVAEHLNAGKAPALAAAMRRLEAMAWPLPAGRWREARRSIADAEARLAAYPDHPLLARPEFRAAEAGALERALAGFKESARAGAAVAFAAFDHFGGQSFFEAYPLDLDARAFMADNFAGLGEQLEGASAERLRRFAALYPRATLGDERWRALGGLFTAAMLKEAGPPAAPDLKAVLAAFHAARQAGFEAAAIPGVKIGFIEVTSRTLLKHRQIEFPAAVEADLPVEVEKAELDEALGTATAEAANYLIVFDVALAKASRRVSETRKVPSRILAGTVKEPNPEFDVVQAEFSVAQNEYFAAKAQSGRGSAGYYDPYNPGAAALGGIFSGLRGIAALVEESQAKTKLDAVMAKLQKTPRYVDKPVFQDYQFDKAEVRAAKTMTVHYHVIDKGLGRYFKSTFDVVERQTFEVLYNVHDKDPEKDALKKQGVTDKDVAEWEEAPATVRLSQLVEHYLANEGRAEALPPLAKLRDEMLADRNRAIAAYKEENYIGTAEKDPRFDSVVVIYVSAKSVLGSGFFVRPDVVMTNYHVVRDQQFVEMRMWGGQETFGKVVAKDVRLDLALVKVQARGRPVDFYDKTRLDLGSTVEVIGHPKRYEYSITRGVVSAVRQEGNPNIEGTKPVLFIQIDAPTNRGNSGGPVFLKDKVVGVVSWGRIDNPVQNLNFAVHYSEAARFLKESLHEGS
jgi:serine protease Do